jgi:hypothetical protein
VQGPPDPPQRHRRHQRGRSGHRQGQARRRQQRQRQERPRRDRGVEARPPPAAKAHHQRALAGARVAGGVRQLDGQQHRHLQGERRHQRQQQHPQPLQRRILQVKPHERDQPRDHHRRVQLAEPGRAQTQRRPAVEPGQRAHRHERGHDQRTRLRPRPHVDGRRQARRGQHQRRGQRRAPGDHPGQQDPAAARPARGGGVGGVCLEVEVVVRVVGHQLKGRHRQLAGQVARAIDGRTRVRGHRGAQPVEQEAPHQEQRPPQLDEGKGGAQHAAKLTASASAGAPDLVTAGCRTSGSAPGGLRPGCSRRARTPTPPTPPAAPAYLRWPGR